MSTQKHRYHAYDSTMNEALDSQFDLYYDENYVDYYNEDDYGVYDAPSR